MKQGRALLVLIAIPALVSLAVTLLTLYVLDMQRSQGQQVIVLPTNSGTAQIPPRTTQAVAEQPGGGNGGGGQGQTATSEAGCQNPIHVVSSGETLGNIAAQYNLTADDLIAMNQSLDPKFNPDLLSVGQEIVIPMCGVPTPAPTSLPTNTPVPTREIPTPIPTATEVPPGTIRVRIAKVLSPGDITKEAISIMNEGSPQSLDGWRISSGKSKDFVFPAFRLFTGGSVTVFTGVGENTSINLYWGLTDALWKIGDTVSLYDNAGKVQDQYKIVAP